MYKWIFLALGFMGLGAVLFVIFTDQMSLMMLSMVWITICVMWSFGKYFEEFNAPERVMERAKKLWRSGNSGKRIQSKRLLRTIAEDYPPAAKALRKIEESQT